MALQGYTVRKSERSLIKDFIETNHYSQSINGCIADFCYTLHNPSGDTVGAMFFGRMAMANQWKRYAKTESDAIELRRLCCVDDTPKNAESFFISRAIKLLKKEWFGSIIVSYADSEYGHEGTIYKASNFKHEGTIKGAKVIFYNGKRYHDKTIRTKYKGVLKPFAAKIKAALDSGEAFYRNTKGKHVYTMTIRKTKQQGGTE